jgi:hypothetical protein
LHELDAIRLGRQGQIEVAFPFSASPTRHQVQIRHRAGRETRVYAMGAIDALGIPAMLGRDTRIESST